MMINIFLESDLLYLYPIIYFKNPRKQNQAM